MLPYLTSADDDDEDRDQAEILRMAVSRAMGLLACGPSSYLYADMYAPTRWESLCKNFRRAALQIHSLPRPLKRLPLAHHQGRCLPLLGPHPPISCPHLQDPHQVRTQNFTHCIAMLGKDHQ